MAVDYSSFIINDVKSFINKEQEAEIIELVSDYWAMQARKDFLVGKNKKYNCNVSKNMRLRLKQFNKKHN
jgi:hypothetical protein